VSGTVEEMTLLTTRLRDVNGVVWHIRNGTIDRVGNDSQGWSRAVIDYPVPYGEDLARIRMLMEQAADGLYRESGWHELMLEKPEVWGAQELSTPMTSSTGCAGCRWSRPGTAGGYTRCGRRAPPWRPAARRPRASRCTPGRTACRWLMPSPRGVRSSWYCAG
jgi:Mechanosensitive ion channel